MLVARQTVAAQLIIGYAPPHMVAADDRRRAAQLRRIFGDDTHPEPSIIIGASDDEGMMLGGAVVEPFVSDELISKEPDAARQFATTHRILAALFVLPPDKVALSLVGTLVLNAILGMNHKPGRYNGY